MPQKLHDNEYGFSVEENNPFFIFPYLQKKALQHFEQKDILDLSRGDPGLGAAPSCRVRRFFGFISLLDTYLNSNQRDVRMHLLEEKDMDFIEETIEHCLEENFTPGLAQEYKNTFDELVGKIQQFAKEEGKEMTRFDVLSHMFKFSTPFGGTYHTPWGEDLVKMVVAGFYRKVLSDQSIRGDDFIFTLGVNDAIGTLFKMLGENGLGYLKEGDTIAISGPAYAPYFNEVNLRGLKVVEVAMCADTGKLDISELKKSEEPIKAFFLITPNNPAGVRYDIEEQKALAKIAEKHNSLVITDEIYSPFHKCNSSIWNFAKKRTLFLCGRSKIERSPGLRFGDVLISEETNDYITKNILDGMLLAPDFKTQFVWSKAPGENNGSFQHTATVPGPSQIIGMLQLLLGQEERDSYTIAVDKNMDEFFRVLGVPRNGKMYYGIFDLNKVPGCTKKDISVDQKLFELAVDYGVILIPALKFFSKNAQEQDDKSNYVRVSLPNLSFPQVTEAARKIHKYLVS